MMRTLTILLAALTVAVCAEPGAAQTDYNGVVSVDSAKARPSESVAVNVWLRNNDLAMSAMSLPLKFSSSALTLDSVSLNGTAWGTNFSGYYDIDNTARKARITILPNDMDIPLSSVSFTNGIVAVLYFKVAAAASPQRVTVDSIYADTALGNGLHFYTRIDVSDNTGQTVYLPDFIAGDIEILAPTGIDDDPDGSILPTDFTLEQNYPNPFNPSTVIAFSMPRSGMARLEVFNILGQQVVTLLDGRRDAGTFTVEFDGSKMPSGIYFYRFQHDGGIETRKMMLLK